MIRTDKLKNKTKKIKWKQTSTAYSYMHVNCVCEYVCRVDVYVLCCYLLLAPASAPNEISKWCALISICFPACFSVRPAQHKEVTQYTKGSLSFLILNTWRDGVERRRRERKRVSLAIYTETNPHKILPTGQKTSTAGKSKGYRSWQQQQQKYKHTNLQIQIL